jgi:hypothetical protein
MATEQAAFLLSFWRLNYPVIIYIMKLIKGAPSRRLRRIKERTF